jgi:hypothetical protein
MCFSASVHAFLNQPFSAVTTTSRATKLLWLQSYKTMAVHALKEYDLVDRIHFCWFLQSVHVGQVDPQLAFFQ